MFHFIFSKNGCEKMKDVQCSVSECISLAVTYVACEYDLISTLQTNDKIDHVTEHYGNHRSRT